MKSLSLSLSLLDNLVHCPVPLLRHVCPPVPRPHPRGGHGRPRVLRARRLVQADWRQDVDRRGHPDLFCLQRRHGRPPSPRVIQQVSPRLLQARELCSEEYDTLSCGTFILFAFDSAMHCRVIKYLWCCFPFIVADVLKKSTMKNQKTKTYTTSYTQKYTHYHYHCVPFDTHSSGVHLKCVCIGLCLYITVDLSVDPSTEVMNCNY